MPEDSELAALPAASPLRNLRDVTIDLAKRLNALLGHLEDEQAYAELRIEVRRGIPAILHVDRGFKLDA